MRGKHDFAVSCYCKTGITPADAGKTQVLADGGNTDEDHPRGCGENFDFTDAQLRGKGSPPRMRGKPNCGQRITW